MVRSGRSWRVSWALLVLWGIGLGVWAVTPLDDNVPTGYVDGEWTSISIECARPIDAHSGPASFPRSILRGSINANRAFNNTTGIAGCCS